MFKNKILLSLLVIVSILTFLTPKALSAAEINLSFDHYSTHAELTKILKTLEKAYPHFMTVKSLGRSYQGREIWAVVLNNPETGPPEHKPGYYMDGNIHGSEVQGTETALYAIWYLLKNYGKTEMATRLLDEKAFYVIPTMNPDSRDYYINGPSDPSTPRTGLVPFDNDRDGLVDEDGPEDLDGDGSFTQMRKKDPSGNYKAHPDDPRIMVPVEQGEKGEYILLGQEGIDNDGDGRINEDSLGGYDMNRNYGFYWQPAYIQRGAGDYPFCFPETKATLDFALANPNIMGAQAFHNTGGMILRGPASPNLGPYSMADLHIYDFIAKKGEKILPGYRYLIIQKDMGTGSYGSMVDFFYSALGIYTFSNELDIPATPRQRRSEGQEDEEMKWRSLARMLDEMNYQDLVLMGEQYTEWKPYKHPLYGDIEIGGVKRFGSRVSPLFKLAETCHRNAAFCFFHADQLPHLVFDKVEVKKLEKNIYQIDITIENTCVTPTISDIAIQKKLHRSDRLKIEGENVKLLAAGLLTDRFRRITQKIKTYKNSFWIKSGVPSFGRVDYCLLVKGKGNIKLIYDSLKGGYYTKASALK